MPLTENWRFSFGAREVPPVGAAETDRGWQRISLPHTWNRMGNIGDRRTPDIDDRRGIGWYRTTLTAPALNGRRAWLEFDAVSIVADVWLNGVHLGRHEGAFSRFRFDATHALKPGGGNILVVKADNSRPVPGSATRHVQPIYGGFMTYGGIYRPVRLLIVDPLHIDLADQGGPGVYIDTPAVTAASGQVRVRTRIANAGRAAERATVLTRVLDATGREVARVRTAVAVASGQTGEAITMLTVVRPRLWNGRKDPYLYRVETRIDDAGGRSRDRLFQPLGFRTMRFDADTGFWLNGVRTPLHGVARHQDEAGKGWALSADDERRDMAMIAEIGANTVRYSHYNHSENIHDIADRTGLVSWTELGLLETHVPVGAPDATDKALDSGKQQLRELIRQNYNHPSVAVWSIGNEVTRLAARKIVPAAPVRDFMRALNAVAKAEDRTRPTVIALCCEPNPVTESLVGVTDLAGYNEYLGWYGEGYASKAEGLGRRMRKLHRERPDLPIAISEYGAGGALSQVTDNPFGGTVDNQGRPQPIAVQNAVHEESWKQIKTLPFLWGSYVWNMFDFANPLRNEGDSSDLNTKGLVSFDRKTRKDSFYLYKAAWSDQPVVHITDKLYRDRAYRVMDVTVYSNAPSVQLTTGQGPARTAACVDSVCRFPGVELRPGANVVEAKARFADGEHVDRATWSFNGDPRTLRLLAGTLTGIDGAPAERFGSDAFFVGGQGKRLNPLESRSFITADVDVDKSGWKPQPVLTVVAPDPRRYEAYREGSFDYVLPLPAGRYRVSLGFAEPDDLAPGARVFDVLADGAVVLPDIDVARAAGGVRRAVERSFVTTVGGDTLRLSFRPRRGEAIVSTIVIEPVGGTRSEDRR
ncbi:glycoside hydrolase family 2 TIM barrel-domain containing protein [Sphingomonas silueang]|uniref:glycoside hydrolase family 2 TIM barrel-domain containing protein n=1 Tax=Sphingomonas silueang TaxID=3156617 RepID=UPI0032B3B564